MIFTASEQVLRVNGPQKEGCEFRTFAAGLGFTGSARRIQPGQLRQQPS